MTECEDVNTMSFSGGDWAQGIIIVKHCTDNGEEYYTVYYSVSLSDQWLGGFLPKKYSSKEQAYSIARDLHKELYEALKNRMREYQQEIEEYKKKIALIKKNKLAQLLVDYQAILNKYFGG